VRFERAVPESHLRLDGNSPDGTRDVASKLAARDHHGQVLHRPVEEGLGAVYLSGQVDGVRPRSATGCLGQRLPDVLGSILASPSNGDGTSQRPTQEGNETIELTVVMPCLNEAETVAVCVRKAVAFLSEQGIDGEVVVADNGSTDGSQRLASKAGARVIPVAERGYGNALLGGISAARGRYVIMGDADDSYDFSALGPFLDGLRSGADLVMGNRFKGGIAPGAMPPLHRYLGNPVLSFIGRLFFRSKAGDFHCGLRGFRRDSVLSLGLQASGMEFASEMVVKATLAGQRVDEVPTTLRPDGRSRPPHLRSWRDGWRHLRFLLLFSPRWLFLTPGILLLALGVGISAAVLPAPLHIGHLGFDVNTLIVACLMIVMGVQAILFGLFTHVYASSEGFLPSDDKIVRLMGAISLERGLLTGAVLGLLGVVGLVTAFAKWGITGFAALEYDSALRLVVPSATALTASCQLIFGSFFLSILGIRRMRPAVPERHASLSAAATAKSFDATFTPSAGPKPSHEVSGQTVVYE
jgi:hypothetical protein